MLQQKFVILFTLHHCRFQPLKLFFSIFNFPIFFLFPQSLYFVILNQYQTSQSLLESRWRMNLSSQRTRVLVKDEKIDIVELIMMACYRINDFKVNHGRTLASAHQQSKGVNNNPSRDNQACLSSEAIIAEQNAFSRRRRLREQPED